MRPGVLVLFVLGIRLYGYCLAVEDAGEVVLFGANEDSCTHYCAGTYPEHTYPNPEDHSACTRGCRLAHMDALIAWPFKPDTDSCHSTCDEAYHGNSRHLFACQTGCNVTTIDQQIANRDQIYPVQTNTSEVSFVFELLATIKHQLSPQFMVVNTELDQLTQHAENMYQYLPCSEVTSFVLIEDNGESMQIKYGYNSDESLVNSKVDYMYVGEEEPYASDTTTYRFSCPWKTKHFAAAGRLLLFVAIGLIAVALFACCCASLMPEEEDKNTTEGEKQCSQVEFCGDKVYIATQLKSPVTFSPGYPQPVPYYGEKKSIIF